MNKYIIIGLLIGVPLNAFRLYMYFKHGKEIHIGNPISIIVAILGVLYGFRGDK